MYIPAIRSSIAELASSTRYKLPADKVRFVDCLLFMIMGFPVTSFNCGYTGKSDETKSYSNPVTSYDVDIKVRQRPLESKMNRTLKHCNIVQYGSRTGSTTCRNNTIVSRCNKVHDNHNFDWIFNQLTVKSLHKLIYIERPLNWYVIHQRCFSS